MASRSSAHFNSEMYIGTRRGRSSYGDFGMEMFPEKYESSEHLVFEDPDSVSYDQRETVKDYTCETNYLFASDEIRRDPGSKYRLNQRSHGWHGSSTDPWKNEGYDTQFHDKDPRGWTGEIPWKEYRRQLEANMRRSDFKDDGDYSVTGGGIHPNTLYKSIRGAQNWVKSRLKIFSTSYESRSNGGVGIYPHTSDVFKSDIEDTSVAVDGGRLSTTFEDPENRQRATMRLSNILHEGSYALRSNTTTDHKVKVASYGKLYSQRGLIPHETQLRIVEDDTPWSELEAVRGTVPRNLVKLMNAATSSTSDATGRKLKHKAASSRDAGKFAGKKESEQNPARGNILTKDIMSLLGITEHEVKFLESKANKNDKHATLMLANVYQMTETVHRLPIQEKMEIRSELLLKAAGGGISGNSDYRKNKDKAEINHKMVEAMEEMTQKKKSKFSESFTANRQKAEGDSEGKLNKLDMPLFVVKSTSKNSENITALMWESNRSSKAAREMKQAVSYSTLKKKAEDIEKNRSEVADSRKKTESARSLMGKVMNPGKFNPLENKSTATIDNKFGENKFLERRIGTSMGDKSKARRLMVSDRDGDSQSLTTMIRKS